MMAITNFFEGVRSKFQDKFYSSFPGCRNSYNKLHTFNETFKKIEHVVFSSFPSATRIASNPALSGDRQRTIETIQNSVVEGKTIREWIALATQRVAKSSKKHLFTHERAELDRLEQHLLALQYRSGSLSKGTDRAQGLSLLQQIEPVIRMYLGHSAICPGRHNSQRDRELPQLTAAERQQLEHTCIAYPELIRKLLQRNAGKTSAKDLWTASFVKWALRSNCSVGVFVKTVEEREKLSSVHLDKRSGSIDGRKGIHFRDVLVDGVARSALCLKMDGRMVAIQGGFKKQAVTLQNCVDPQAPGLTLTIKEILKLFKAKTTGYGDVEYIRGGVRNWNPIVLASKNSQTGAYHHIRGEDILEEFRAAAPLPPLSQEQMEQWYGLQPGELPLNPGQWAIAIRASRTRPNRNILDAHGYVEALQYRDGQYHLFPLSIQPKKFPKNIVQKFLFFASTTEAGLHYPDESNSCSHRQRMGILIPLTDAEKGRLDNTLKERYKSAKDGNVIFQLGGDNCAFHAQDIFDEVVAAPFYNKIQEVLNSAIESDSIYSQWRARANFSRAFQGLNHDLLDGILTKMVDHLITTRNTRELQALLSFSTDLLSRAYQAPFPALHEQEINFDHPNLKAEVINLLTHTIEAIRFYRMDLFKSETDQPFLAFVNSLIQAAPWRWLKRSITQVVLFIMGSWRWFIVRKKSETANPEFHIKSVVNNPLVQEGYLNHPARLWERTEQLPASLASATACAQNLQTLLPQRVSG